MKHEPQHTRTHTHKTAIEERRACIANQRHPAFHKNTSTKLASTVPIAVANTPHKKIIAAARRNNQHRALLHICSAHIVGQPLVFVIMRLSPLFCGYTLLSVRARDLRARHIAYVYVHSRTHYNITRTHIFS